MALGDIIQLSFNWLTDTGSEMVNVLHYAQTEGASTLDYGGFSSLVDAITNELTGDWTNMIRVELTLSNVSWHVLNGPANGFVGASFTYTGLAGSSGGTVGPYERCIVMQAKTHLAGRKNRGRIFSPFPPLESFTDAGELVTLDISTIIYASAIALANDLVVTIADAAAGHWQYCIAHGGLLPTFTTVREVDVSHRVGIQRRRRLGVGA